MTWDGILLFILASFGAVSLLLAQVSDVLSRLPQVIRAWRRVRQEWNGGVGSRTHGRSAGADSSGTRVADSNGERPRRAPLGAPTSEDGDATSAP
ncbi:hypothetical protein AB0F30_25155 [Streptomyces sp. NPDC029006]|uniref:hypothetical protein n=1 Tax=Streptomyces sp. NPDC029006 TaxID=3155467 RepID=UPI0033DD7BE5